MGEMNLRWWSPMTQPASTSKKQQIGCIESFETFATTPKLHKMPSSILYRNHQIYQSAVISTYVCVYGLLTAVVFVSLAASICPAGKLRPNYDFNISQWNTEFAIHERFDAQEFHANCADFVKDGNESSYTAQRNIVSGYNSNEESDKQTMVTITGFFTYDRRYMIKPFARHWSGPMILVLYGTPVEAKLISVLFQTSVVLSSRHNIRIIFVEKSNATKYLPFNILRNMAIKAVDTKYVLPLDIDNLPSPQSYETTQKELSSLHRKYECDKVAYVIPALQTNLRNRLTSKQALATLPSTKSNVVEGWKTRYFPFGKPNTPFTTHGQTNFSRWLHTDSAYEVNWRFRYEPSVVYKTLDRQIKFESTFVGYGVDKITLTILLAFKGYKFVVLPSVFTLHIPHPKSQSRLQTMNYTTSENRCFYTIGFDFLKRNSIIA